MRCCCRLTAEIAELQTKPDYRVASHRSAAYLEADRAVLTKLVELYQGKPASFAPRVDRKLGAVQGAQAKPTLEARARDSRGHLLGPLIASMRTATCWRENPR
jgi:hypothetical protein